MNIFISGGCKNGKSYYAQELAWQMAAEQQVPLYYLATMIPADDEDRARIRRHLAEREGWGFDTIERGRDICGILPQTEPAADVADTAQSEKQREAAQDSSRRDALCGSYGARTVSGTPDASDVHAVSGTLSGSGMHTISSAQGDSGMHAVSGTQSGSGVHAVSSARSGLDIQPGSGTNDFGACTVSGAPIDPKGVFLLDSVTALLSNEMFQPGGKIDLQAGSCLAAELAEFARRTGNTVFVSDYLYSDARRFDAYTESYRRALAAIDRTLARICEQVVEVSFGMKYLYKSAGSTCTSCNG